MLTAITRAVSPRFNECELTHFSRVPIDVEEARRQHAAYEQALRSLGVNVVHLPTAPELPDSVFVEDAALVVDELAVVLRPGAETRRPETAAIEKALAPFRKTVRIDAPGTIDGGDVLRLGRTVYVGLSTRTNIEAVKQLRDILRPWGYEVIEVEVPSCLHLKSAVTQASPDTLLINPNLIDPSVFNGWRCIEVDPDEPSAANILYLPTGAVYAAHHPKTAIRLEQAGVKLTLVEATEVAKAEGAVTCCSIVFEA